MGRRLSKRILITLTSLSLLAVLILYVSATLAYLTDHRYVINTVKFGDAEVQLLDSSRPASGDETIRIGEPVSRSPKVENTGTVPCYVRAVVTVSDGLFGGGNISDFFSMNELSESWTLTGGLWGSEYATVTYNGILSPGETTPEIFSGFTINGTAANGTDVLEEGSKNTFDMSIIVEAVQSRLGDTAFDSAEDAFAQLMP